MQDHKLLTTAALARELGVSPTSIRRWAADGTILFVRVGSHRRYFLADVLAALRGSAK